MLVIVGSKKFWGFSRKPPSLVKATQKSEVQRYLGRCAVLLGILQSGMPSLPASWAYLHTCLLRREGLLGGEKVVKGLCLVVKGLCFLF